MEYVIKVNAQAIENKSTHAKFIVFNTYVKNDNGEWVKFNVKFAKDIIVKETGKGIIERNSYIYVDESAISIDELGKYPTIYIKAVLSQKVIEFDKKSLAKFFKQVDSVDLGNPIAEEDLPFDTDNGNGEN